jgi:hypothetical protein
MALTKTLATLLERAERKGKAIKRVRYNQIMGNENSGITDFVNQWEVLDYVDEDNEAIRYVDVNHYDTNIAQFVYSHGTWELKYFYGESNADRDALNGLCSYFGIRRGFSYSRKHEAFMEVQY